MLLEAVRVTEKVISAFCKCQTMKILEKVHEGHIEIICLGGDGPMG
jgi:hypothetical protein